MKKVYYFPHEYNSANDPKIICLLGNYGGLGYGTFWIIIEMLHQDNKHKLPLKRYIYEAIAKQMLTNAEQIETIVKDCIKIYELLESDDVFFWSKRVLENIEFQMNISKMRSEAGKKGAQIKQLLSKVQQSSAKKRKGKEIKEKELLLAFDFWNSQTKWIGERVSNPTVGVIGLFKECKKLTSDIEKAWAKINPTNEEWKEALRNYAKEIINRGDNDYARHRFSLYEFIIQKNGFKKFINK